MLDRGNEEVLFLNFLMNVESTCRFLGSYISKFTYTKVNAQLFIISYIRLYMPSPGNN